MGGWAVSVVRHLRSGLMGIAVVTGGGRGIGAAIAKRLEADGHVVHRLDQNPGPGVTVCNITDEEASRSRPTDRWRSW